MSRKFLIGVSLIAFTAFGAISSQAATRSDEAVAVARAADPAEEIRCLEAFINSEFDLAHMVCLPLAQGGLRDAQLVTGLMYALGEGVERNPDLAKWWLGEAERNGSPEAREALVEFNLE